MFGFNLVDLAALILLAIAIFTGIKVGALGQLTVVGGFFTGLIFSSWLYPRILPIEDRTLLTTININLVLITSVIIASLSSKLNRKLHRNFKSVRLKKLDTAAGGILGFMSMAVLIWLLLSAIMRLPFVGLSNLSHSAFTTQTISRFLPKTPSAFATFNNHINPNNPPFLFYDKASETDFTYSEKTYDRIVSKTADSVVSVTGLGCNGISSGSGFVVQDGLILTNAHVVAGVNRPIIKHAGRSYEATPILFDANLDFAVLRVYETDQEFSAPPLKLMDTPLAENTTVGVIGYPDGKFTASPGVIRENTYVFGRNIYDIGNIGRDVYIVQSYLTEGISGGPVVAPDGKVAGIIFANFYQRDDLGYALASSRLNSLVQQASASKERVGVGICVAQWPTIKVLPLK